MAFQTGTCVGHWAFLEIIRTMALANGWVQERYDNTNLNGESQIDLEMILRGEGLSGTENIWAAFTTFQSALSDYYNISLSGHIGYVPGNTLELQPGWSDHRWVPMWDLTIEYWLAINAQRIAFGAKVETHYYSGYAGKYFSFATPGQFPYPICVAGTSGANSDRYSTSPSVDIFNGAKLRDYNGNWITVSMIPYENPYFDSIKNQGIGNFVSTPPRDTGGDYPLLPITLVDGSTYGAFGDLDGIFFTTGYNSAVENVVQVGLDDYIKIANNQGTGFLDYFALKEE